MYDLYIANKNYSSWSLRPWVLLSELRIPFVEHQLFFGEASGWDAYRKISPTGKVPCLIDGDTVVWDSLSIAEYLAERHDGVWPSQGAAQLPAGRRRTIPALARMVGKSPGRGAQEVIAWKPTGCNPWVLECT